VRSGRAHEDPRALEKRRTGLVDPAKVVRVALQDAASIAGLLITTDSISGQFSAPVGRQSPVFALKLEKECSSGLATREARCSRLAITPCIRPARGLLFLIQAKKIPRKDKMRGQMS
jgi:hypothetical protein